MEDKYIVAIEIGSSKIKGALARIDHTGTLSVLCVKEERALNCVRYGQIRNVEEVSNKIGSIIERLQNTKLIAGTRIAGVYVGLSGATVSSTPAESSLTFDCEQEITTAEIERLVDMSTQDISSDRDIYEVLPVRFVVDNMAAPNPVGSFGSSIRGTFTIISGARGIRSNINRVLIDRLNLSVKGYLLAPVAVADTIVTQDEKQLGCVFVDFGAETTTVAIYKKGALNYLSTLPMGSRNITRDIESLDYLEERAEMLKCSEGVYPDVSAQRTATSETLAPARIINCISARAGEIIANIAAQIEYAGFKPAELTGGIILTGGGAKLKGFLDMLSKRTDMKVRMGLLPLGISLTDSSVKPSEDVDVISLLRAAARKPKECVESKVEPADPAEQTNGMNDKFDREYPETDDFDEDDLSQTRIGQEDIDDPLDNDYDKRKHETKKPKKQQRTQKPHSPGLLERLARLLKDNEEDRFDEINDN